MSRLLRLVLLRLLLVAGLCLAPLGAGDGLYAYAQPAAAVSLTDAAHHEERDSSSGQPICALVRCECHACPHLAVMVPPSWPIRWDVRGRWLSADRVAAGVAPEVEPPPPRATNVEMA
ncbi:hypothetical protein V5F38_12750 [Xanthobacter sp. V0B-10]|uniref:hypothetical protein n=1 Tax=Xanthobacter albus TaxID=3119929 RepID=UPI00372B4F17